VQPLMLPHIHDHAPPLRLEMASVASNLIMEA